jgi:quercetin 2,3-dioxygenase
MITLWPGGERGQFQLDWLDSRHTFSFGEFYDPAKMGWRHLRVVNEDQIAPSGGFPAHPHRNMEIFSYLVAGELEHLDSLGHKARIGPGRVQLMSAGVGIRHSEYNPSATTPTHLLQIWILPQAAGGEPQYQELDFTEKQRANRLHLLADPNGAEGAMRIRQQTRIATARLARGQELPLPLGSGQGGWLQLAAGALTLVPGGVILAAGDAAAVERESSLVARATADSEFLWFTFD